MTPQQREGMDYPSVSRKVFGISRDKEWHPYLSWSEENKKKILDWFSVIPHRNKNIMLETFCGSGQSKWDDLMTIRTMEICKEQWGSCNFLFASHKNTGQFKDFENYFSCADFTPRETALLINYCDLFVGISAGISVVTSAWGLKPVLKMQYCGSYTCSTVSLHAGELNLIMTDAIGHEKGRIMFEKKLKEVISKIQ